MSEGRYRSGNPSGVPLNLSAAEVADIVRLRQQGMTLRAIAERKNMARESVARYLHKHHQQQWTRGEQPPVATAAYVPTVKREWRPSKQFMEQAQRAADYRAYKSLRDD